MLYPISKIEVLEKMNTLDAIHGKESGRKWHELRLWLDQKAAAEHHAHLTPESLSSSQAVVNASALEKSDGDSSHAQAQVA